MLKLDFIGFEPTIDLNKKEEILKKLNTNEAMCDFLEITKTISQEELSKVLELKSEIQRNADLFIVVGIGGSYLGAKAMIDALNPYFKEEGPKIIFAGTSLSSAYLKEVLAEMEDKSVYVNVISKSGNTLEPSIAFELIEKEMKTLFPDYQKRIIVTTDKEHGSLRSHASIEGYRTLEVPTNIGGRYSCLSVVGLLPMAVKGVDIESLLRGAASQEKDLTSSFAYAFWRYNLECRGKEIELVTFYEEKLRSFGDWVVQLFAETQGKNKKGIFPVSNFFTANLHSLGQYIQEGKDITFETVIKVKEDEKLFVPSKNMDLHELNNKVIDQVASAHLEGNTPSVIIELEKLDAYNLGELIYFYFVAAAIGGYLLEVNPFDQPGVERYKEKVNELFE